MGMSDFEKARRQREAAARDARRYVSARLYKDVIGRTCCELTTADGTVHGSSGRPMEPGELEELLLPWCERNGVTAIDERELTTSARERLDNEAALYKLERP